MVGDVDKIFELTNALSEAGTVLFLRPEGEGYRLNFLPSGRNTRIEGVFTRGDLLRLARPR